MATTRATVRVATSVVASLREHWVTHPPTKPVLLILQGDPLTEHGISAITRRVASTLGVPRGLIVLDEDIADYHSPNVDRENVVLETTHSVERLGSSLTSPESLTVEAGVQTLIQEKNREREALGKPPLADYFPRFAMLQEISKGTFSALCGDDIGPHQQRHRCFLGIEFLHRRIGARTLTAHLVLLLATLIEAIDERAALADRQSSGSSGSCGSLRA